MNLCAQGLGYNVPVVYATCEDEIDGEDDQLVEYLEAHALKTAQRPYFTVPTSRDSLPESNDRRDARSFAQYARQCSASEQDPSHAGSDPPQEARR